MLCAKGVSGNELRIRTYLTEIERSPYLWISNILQSSSTCDTCSATSRKYTYFTSYLIKQFQHSLHTVYTIDMKISFNHLSTTNITDLSSSIQHCILDFPFLLRVLRIIWAPNTMNDLSLNWHTFWPLLDSSTLVQKRFWSVRVWFIMFWKGY